MSRTPRPRLHTKLLLVVALTNAAAVVLVLVTMWVTEGLSQPFRWLAVGVLLVLVGLVWASVVRRKTSQLVEVPLAASIEAAEAIAQGDTARRLPDGTTQEFHALAQSVNRMTEQLLDAHQQRLRVEKLATLGRLAAGIAHEVGNPLAAISTYAHLARTRAESIDAVNEPLDALDREVDRIDRIVRGLLDYARPRHMTPKPVAVDEVLQGAVQLLSDQGVLRRIVIEREFDAREGLVFAERHDLEQVFVNLLLNAADAMNGIGTIALHSRTTSVTEATSVKAHRRSDAPTDRFEHVPNKRAQTWIARTDRPDAVLQVVIADSGSGVKPEDTERVFEPFFTTKQTGRGTGLGLAIVARIVENLGGAIWVQRAREGGAAFVLLLPLHSQMHSENFSSVETAPAAL